MSSTTQEKEAPALTLTSSSSTSSSSSKGKVAIAICIGVFILLWFAAGIAAFYMSLQCMKFPGTTNNKIGGFIIAILFGPLYWFYYKYKGGYCKGNISVVDVSTADVISALMPSPLPLTTA
jgi:hypothetical protein